MTTNVSSESGIPVPSRSLRGRDVAKSVGLHSLVLVGVLAIPAGPLRRSAEPQELEVEFHSPLEVPPPVAPPPAPVGALAAGLPMERPSPRPAAPAAPKSIPAGAPVVSSTEGVPAGPEEVPPEPAPPQKKAGTSGLLAFRDQLAGLADDKNAPRLGADAHLSAADDVGQGSSQALLTTNAPGGSGGINVAALSRQVGGGGGGGAGGGGRMQGVTVGRATSSIAGIGGGGGSRALGGGGGTGDAAGTRGGAGNSRTDEEIQIVFDRHKASFYRLYHVELRKDPTLRGQMVLRLTIEPDGSVSMCTLQSSDMHAPELAAQVVDRVRTINFGAKEGVQALTIVYPIDFLPAA